MGFLKQHIISRSSKSDKISYKKNMQMYYCNLYDDVMERLKNEGHQKAQIDNILSSIFSRTKMPTKTSDIKLLKMIDVDKIISLNERSLRQNSEQVKYMRMVASIKHQMLRNNEQDSLRQINNLVRMARLHFIQVNRRLAQHEQQSEQQSQQNQAQHPQITINVTL